MYNKRGLSAIVATILIILLVVAGVALLWSPIRKLITEQSDEVEASCLLANPQITKACMSTPSTVSITISNGAESEIDGGFQFIYGNSGNLDSTVTNTTQIGINQVRTLLFANTSIATEVKMAPIIDGKNCATGSTASIASSC